MRRRESLVTERLALLLSVGVSAFSHHRWSRGPVMAFILALAPVALTHVHACGLEPTLKGGFTVSYPGALDIAVAVSHSRRAGLLPPAIPITVSNEALLQQMLEDLGLLRSRLNVGLAKGEEDSTTSFSLVLVGPGLWSHYHSTPDGIKAEYHTDGPFADHTVVLTHHSVLRALLKGSMTTERATGLGLITFSGSPADSVRNVFASGFRPRI